MDLALNLICRSDREKLFARRFFAPGSPLVHFQVVELLDEALDRQPTLLRKFMKVEETLLRWLLEHPPTSLQLGSFVASRSGVAALEVDDAGRTRITNLVDSLQRSGLSNTIVRVTANTVEEQEAAAEAIANALGKPLIKVQTNDLESKPGKVNVMVRDAVLMEARLRCLSRRTHRQTSTRSRVRRPESSRASSGKPSRVRRARSSPWAKRTRFPIFPLKRASGNWS